MSSKIERSKPIRSLSVANARSLTETKIGNSSTQLLRTRPTRACSRAAARRCTAARPRRDADANAEPEAIAHHFTEAGLDDLAIEWWGKAGDQALRRSAFQEAIAHLGKAIEMADRAGVRAQATTGSRSTATVAASHRLRQRAIAARGYGALETTEAFAKPASWPLATRMRRNDWRPTTGCGSAATCEANYRRCGRTGGISFTRHQGQPDLPEAGIAHRITGVTHRFAGEYAEAREQLERALRFSNPAGTTDLAVRFGHDPGIAAMLYLAIALWPLGEVERASPWVKALRRGSLRSRTSARSRLDRLFGAVRTDARRPCAARRAPSC